MPRLTEYALDKSGKEVNFAIVIYLIKPEGRNSKMAARGRKQKASLL
jgi:hypothetical protein